MRLTSALRQVQRSRIPAAGARLWWTPRLVLEIAAGVLAVTLVATIWPSSGAPRAGGGKIALQALPAPRFTPTADDPATSQFMEGVALAHLGPLRPETDITAPLSPPPVVAMTTKRIAAPHDKVPGAKPAALHATAPKPAGVTEVAKVDAGTTALGNGAPRSAAEKTATHVPMISAMVDRLPTGRDLIDGVGALRRKITGLVSW